VERQQFIRVGLGVTVAVAAGGSTVAELITATQPTPVPSVVGLSHVAEIRAAATAFANWDNRHGSGFVREAVGAQLGYCAKLLTARCSETVRPELFSAVGYLGNITAFTAYDSLRPRRRPPPVPLRVVLRRGSSRLVAAGQNLVQYGAASSLVRRPGRRADVHRAGAGPR